LREFILKIKTNKPDLILFAFPPSVLFPEGECLVFKNTGIPQQKDLSEIKFVLN
jgi:hypothetical protein